MHPEMHLAAESPPPEAFIPARTEKEAMDWSLVLASQSIETVLLRFESQWLLKVRTEDYDRAVQAIGLFQRENRKWDWRRALPPTEPIELRALFWSLGIACIHALTMLRFYSFWIAGSLDSTAFWNGEWWRIFTATLLHADLAHLTANATLGFLLLALAIPPYGAGLTLLASLLAGAAGNLASLLIHSEPYRGVGASGVVMGFLGLLAAQSLGHWRERRIFARQAARAALACVLLFVLVGLDPTSDVMAHFGGFCAGLVLGVLLTALPEEKRMNPALQLAAALGFALILFTASALALRHAEPLVPLMKGPQTGMGLG